MVAHAFKSNPREAGESEFEASLQRASSRTAREMPSKKTIKTG